MNPNAKHTPGPWHTEGQSVVSDNGEMECSITTGKFQENHEESRANASLIAAAPALLEALKRLCDSLAWEENRSGTTYSGYESAKAVIVQAEGGAQ